MVKRKLLLALVFVSILLAGCSGQGQIGEKDTKSQGEGVQIEGPECRSLTNPNQGCSELLEGESVRITLSVTNTGGNAVVIPFENIISEAQNSEERAFNAISGGVLKTRCPSLFSAVESSLEVERIDERGISHKYTKARGAADPKVRGEFFRENRRVELDEGEELDFEWTLRRTNKEVPSPGFSCELSFAVDTDQLVNTRRKVQLLRDRGANRREIEAPVASAAPLVLNIDAPSNWIQQEGGFNAQLFVENQGPGTPRGDIEVSGISTRPSELLNCQISEGTRNPNALEYLENADRQPRKTFVCSPSGSLRVESNIVTLSARAEFSYRYDIDDINIEVVPLER